ncbi:hypothetical protein GJ744_010053 [Endocarpon pusillum]|uniref:Uncharacterized protein n=1 Tax=Endocarpon pusillum TaxID=364733 RepID=A0A8H7AI82_9EURO|nr:hypothetical protein GJ744_010053 [Endocarpon pusillum]
MSFPEIPEILESHATFNQPSHIQEEGFTRQSAHRGVVAKDGVVQQSCSDDFLILLCLEFCKAQSHQLIIKLRQLDQAEQDQRIGFIAHETRRLLHNPQLFPSESTRVRFLTFLAADSRFQLCEAISDLLMQTEVQVIQETWQKNVSRKGYLDGTRGWENFLLSDAPGLPFTSARTTPQSMVQVLPPVASRIVADFEREERQILHFVRQNNPPLGRPAQMTTMIDFDNPTDDSEKIPAAELPQIVKQAIFRPNPYPQPRLLPLTLLTTAAEHIEDYSSFMDRLEADPVNPNAQHMVLSSARILPALSIRTWKLPTKAEDLRYTK